VTATERAIADVLRGIGSAVIAVSGGVDSMTLAHLAARSGAQATMAHAVSPAVPAAATARVREHAARFGWRLTVIDAGEFVDPRYRANPVNRCYFCKINLYGVIAARFGGDTILSGTNRDDLSDFRPGLEAASEHAVRHPFVEAGINKTEIRAIADGLGLRDLAELPAAPCLSSRIATGVAIDAADLALVETVEERLRAALGPIDLRCRIGAGGVRIELGGDGLAEVYSAERAPVKRAVEEAVARAGHAFLGYGPYRRGSAFLRSSAGA
jgi:uncharacterized protein